MKFLSANVKLLVLLISSVPACLPNDCIAQSRSEMEAYCQQLLSVDERRKLQDAGMEAMVEQICSDLRAGEFDEGLRQLGQPRSSSGTASSQADARNPAYAQNAPQGQYQANCTFLAKGRRIPVDFDNKATDVISTVDGESIGRWYLDWLRLERNAYGQITGTIELSVVNASSCVLNFNGSFFRDAHSRQPVSFVDWGNGFKVEPNSQRSATRDFTLSQSNELWFEASTGYLSK